MPLTRWEAYYVHLLACDVQEFGCTIPEDACELLWNLIDNRLWIGIAASSIDLGLGAQVRGRFSPDDPYSLEGITQSCPGAFGSTGSIPEEFALDCACFGCGGPRSHTGPSHGPPAQGHRHVACSERAAQQTVRRQGQLFAADRLRPSRRPDQLSPFHRLL